MTDRIRTLTVVLDDDIRVDDAQEVVSAISLLRCVGSVEAGPVVDVGTLLARRAARRVLLEELLEGLKR